METLLYQILIGYFLIGAILIYLSNKRKDTASAKKNWIKYFVYLIIVNALFVSILLEGPYFTWISWGIAILGLGEITWYSLKPGKSKIGLMGLLVYLPLAVLFVRYSYQATSYLFFTLFLVTIFDAFSQLSGQLFGRRQITRISPNKTYEGLLGGGVVALATAVLIPALIQESTLSAVLLALCIIIFAFIGDLLASLLKRRFEIKDYSRLLPGHGGILDRFDSLIMANACTGLLIPWL